MNFNSISDIYDTIDVYEVKNIFNMTQIVKNLQPGRELIVSSPEQKIERHPGKRK